MNSLRGSPEQPSALRQEAQVNIWRHLLRHSRITRLCVVLAAATGAAGTHEKNDALTIAPSIPLVVAATAHGVGTRRKCSREVDAYAVNVVHGRDPFNRLDRETTRKLEIQDGELQETHKYDLVAGMTDIELATFRWPEPFAIGTALGAGVMGDAIARGSYLPQAQNFLYGIEGILVGGAMIALGTGSATLRMRAYNRQLDNIEGPSSIDIK